MANTVYMSKTGLIGGEATKLDSIDGAGLVDNDVAFVNVSNVQYIYRLDADSAAAESSPNIIAPDTNAGDKRWILQGLNGASLNMPGLTASLPVFTDGSKNLVSKSVADTLTALGVGASSFCAYLTSTLTDYTGDGTGGYFEGAYWTELFDNGGVFSNGLFTVPETGFYVIGASLHLSGLASGHNNCTFSIIASSGQNFMLFYGNPYSICTSGESALTSSVLIYLVSGAVVQIAAIIAGVGKTVDIIGGTSSFTKFWGYRLK